MMHARELRFVMISRGIFCGQKYIAGIISRRKGMRRMYGRVIIRDQHRGIVFCQEAANANRRHDLRVPAASYIS